LRTISGLIDDDEPRAEAPIMLASVFAREVAPPGLLVLCCANAAGASARHAAAIAVYLNLMAMLPY